MQIAAILVLLAFPPGSDPRLVMLGYVLIYVAAIMTLISMVMYLRAAWPTLACWPRRRVIRFRVPSSIE